MTAKMREALYPSGARVTHGGGSAAGSMDHGIGTERLGDGIDGGIAEYWELLFDSETGYWREEIQDNYDASGCDGRCSLLLPSPVIGGH